MTPPVTVVVPVGPFEHYGLYLEECLESIADQTLLPQEVLLIDDMYGIREDLLPKYPFPVTCWMAPWRLGVAHAFNMGVSLAFHDLVFMLPCDDTMMPRCLEACLAAYEVQDEEKKDITYYAVGVSYSDDREDQWLPSHHGMVTKALWRRTGGFPIESASGAPDCALHSIFLANPEAGQVQMVELENERVPLCAYRVHPQTDTGTRSPWQRVILETRDILTNSWGPPQWGRMS